MTKKREGYQNVTFQFPDALYAAIEKAANERSVSLTTVVVEGLCKLLKVKPSALPPKTRQGRRRNTKGR